MAEPGDHSAAPAGGRRGLRASHADREQVIEVLKDAFVQGRLDHGEFGARVGQALASRTYAELAALTADIPAGQAPRQPARLQNRMPQSHPVRNGAIGVGVSVPVAAAAVLGAFTLDDQAGVALFMLGAFIVLVVVPFIILATAITVSDRRRSRGQLPARPGQGGHAPEVQRPGAGPDPALPGASPDETRADMRSHRSRPGRRPNSCSPRARARRGLRPVPGAV
jgi:Domain of unknown function (DUF1707)